MSLWGKRRQASYLLLGTAVVGVVGIVGFFILKPSPSCFDDRRNGAETGIDCGGACERACVGIDEVRTSWIRVFSVSPGIYYTIAFVENPNPNIGSKRIAYTFRLLDEEGLLVTTRRGETFVNPREKLIIFEGGIETGGRQAARATLAFDGNFEWRRIEAAKPALLVEKRSFANDGQPRLEIAVTNDSIYNLRDIRVPVILSDRNGNAFAGSSTIIDRLAKDETKVIVFTWPVAFPAPPAAIDVYPRVNLFTLP